MKDILHLDLLNITQNIEGPWKDALVGGFGAILCGVHGCGGLCVSGVFMRLFWTGVGMDALW